MPTKVRHRRQTNTDHIIEGVLGLQAAQKALARLDDANLSTAAREACQRMDAAVTVALNEAADVLEALGGFVRTDKVE